jgi:hypothetical protein
LGSYFLEGESIVDTGHQALVLFYAFFWAAALNMTGRYQAFDTPSMWVGERRAKLRFCVSVILLNILPILWLVFLYREVIPDDNELISIIAAALASLSVFGFHRILHAILASEQTYHWFYTL